jgi:hypothetical protein
MIIIFETLSQPIGLNVDYIKSIVPMTDPKTTLVLHFGDRMTICETVVKGSFKDTNMKILRSAK